MNNTYTRFIVVRLDIAIDNCSYKHTMSTDILGAYKTKEAALEHIDSMIFNCVEEVSSMLASTMFGYKTIGVKITDNWVDYSYNVLGVTYKDIYMIKEIEINYDD